MEEQLVLWLGASEPLPLEQGGSLDEEKLMANDPGD